MTKIISLSDEAYGRLKALKGNDKSFTKIVIELTEPKKPKSLLDYAGVWKDRDDLKEIFDKILEERHKPDNREIPSW